ncbi:Ubiquitin carboxyl-terminal hydrolase 5 [Chlorella vulgaris]
MVLDPQLPAHLAHWGIDVMRMEKSEKSMAELEIDQNLSLEFDKITEAGAALQPLTGPGYVGLVNLGNSCYMNSVLQVLWALPELRSRYVDAAAAIYGSAPQDPSSDFAAQFAKIGTALLTGNTKAPPPAPAPVAAPAAAAAAGEGAAAAGAADGPQPMSCEAEGVETEGGSQAGVQGQQGSGHSVKPQAFKSLVGRGHPEFSSGRQQDAQEYFGHLLEVASRAEHAAGARLAAAAVQEGSDAVPQAGQASLEGPTARLFKFGTEDRIQCGVTGRVAYISSESTCLGLHIPLEAAENLADLQRYQERQQKRQKVKGEEAEPGAAAAAAVTAATKHEEEEARVVPRVPFSACLAGYAGDSLVEGYYSLAAGKNTQAIKRTRFSSFPPYLLVQLQRYYTDDSWQPRKKEVEVPAPQHLDLEGLRGQGLQPGEQLQPDDGPSATQTATANPSAATPSTTPPPPTADETIVGQLVSMGFTANASRRAALAVGNSNADAATAWACEHMEDPDFNDALPEPAAAEAAGAAGGGGGAAAVAAAQPSIPEPSPDSLAMLAAMGFTERQARGALAACQGSMERAADWLFSREGDLEAAVEAVLGGGGAGGGAGVAGPDAAAAAGPAAGPAAAPLPLLDGPGRYELLGIVSHIGANTGCGHYVAHVKKDGRWAIFDDEKVAASEAPPFDRGYLYLYRRCE